MNYVLSKEAIVSLEEETLSFLNTDEILALAEINYDASISVTYVDILDQQGPAVTFNITGKCPAESSWNEILVSIFEDEAALIAYEEFLMENSIEEFSSVLLESGSSGVTLIETPSNVVEQSTGLTLQ